MPDTDSLYLNQLKFDPKLNGSWMHKLIKNVRLLFLVIFALIGAGIFSFITLPRELNPEVNIPIVNVVTTLPGASPGDVEKLITQEIEKEVQNVPALDQMTSNSSNSLSVVTLQFVSTEDPDEALDAVQQRVDTITNLPEEASDPRVSKLDFNEQPVWIVALSGSVNRYSLTETAQAIADKLENTNGIRRVDISGDIEEEIAIKLKPETLIEYQVTANDINNALATNNITLPAGSITVNDLEYSLTVNNEFSTIEQIRQLPITNQGSIIALGQIADVYYQAKESDSKAYHRVASDQRNNAVQLSIYKSDTETIIGAVEKAQEILETETEKNNSVEYINVLNLSTDIDESFSELQSNFAQTIILVFILLFTFLGIRQASIASISIPLTFLSAFIIMNITGITLNFLSLFSLLLALGLVVDDAIVIVQAANNYGKKFSPVETGLLVFRDFVVPIWTTTLTTVWAFLPLLLATGIIGEFIKSIPVVVSATLLSSTTIAVLINIPLTTIIAKLQMPKRVKIALAILAMISSAIIVASLAGSSPLKPLVIFAYILLLFVSVKSSDLIKKQLKKRSKPHKISGLITRQLQKFNLNSQNLVNQGIVDFGLVTKRYRNLLNAILEHRKNRYIVYLSSIGFVLLSFIFLGTGLLKNEFFPKSDNENLYINVEAPAGQVVEVTDNTLQDIEKQLIEYSEIATLTTLTGSNISPDDSGSGGSGSNRGYISVTLVDQGDRDRSSIEIAEAMRVQFAEIQTADVTVTETSGGPPAGADFQINIRGESLETLETIAEDFKTIVEAIPGTININTSLELTPGEVQVNLIPEELAERQLSAIQVGSWLRTAVSGSDNNTIRQDGDDLDLMVILDEEFQNLSQLQTLTLPSQMGAYQLSEIATFSLETAPTSISREDGQRVVRVTAATSQGASSTEILSEFNKQVEDYQAPSGYSWDSGGVNEENNRSVQSILQAMSLSFILILITMVLQLESFRKAFIVMLVIPLAVAGVFFNFTILQIPLSFPALIGVLALFGIVVNNSIMLVEKINQNLKQGFSVKDAISDACSSRIEPIFLTSLTTSAGLLPITISDPLWRGLGGSIIAGLSVSGILILILLPTVYYEVFKETSDQSNNSTSQPNLL